MDFHIEQGPSMPCQGLHLQRRHQRPQRFALVFGAAAAAHGARAASWHGGGAQRGDAAVFFGTGKRWDFLGNKWDFHRKMVV